MLINNFFEIYTYAYDEGSLNLPMQNLILNNICVFSFLQPNIEMEPFHSMAFPPTSHIDGTIPLLWNGTMTFHSTSFSNQSTLLETGGST
jgi:hypothetical protein